MPLDIIKRIKSNLFFVIVSSDEVVQFVTARTVEALIFPGCCAALLVFGCDVSE